MAYCIKLSEFNESRQRMVGGPWKGACQDCSFPPSSSSSGGSSSSSGGSSSSSGGSSSGSEGSSSGSEGSSFSSDFFACVKQKNAPDSIPFCLDFLLYDNKNHQVTLGPFFGDDLCHLCQMSDSSTSGSSSGTSESNSSSTSGSSSSQNPSGYYCIEPWSVWLTNGVRLTNGVECVKVSEYSPEMGKIIDSVKNCKDCDEQSSSSSSSSLPPPTAEMPPVPPPTGFGDTHHTWSPQENGSSRSFTQMYTGPLVFKDDNSPASGEHRVIEWVERHYDGTVHGWVSTRKEVCIFEGTNICTDLNQVGSPKAQMQKLCRGLFASNCGTPPCNVNTTWCQISISLPSDFSEIESVGGLYLDFMNSLSSLNPQTGGFNQIGKSTSFSGGGCVIPAGSTNIESASTVPTSSLRDLLYGIQDKEWAPLSQDVLSQRMQQIAALSSKRKEGDDPCCGAPEYLFGDGPCSEEEGWGEKSCLYKCVGSIWQRHDNNYCKECIPPRGETSCSPEYYYEFGTCNDCEEGYSTPCGCLPSGCKCVNDSCECPPDKECPPPPTSSSSSCECSIYHCNWISICDQELGEPEPEGGYTGCYWSPETPPPYGCRYGFSPNGSPSQPFESSNASCECP